jgi:hypothetical protein
LVRKRRQAQLRWLARVTAFLRRLKRQQQGEGQETAADGNLSPRLSPQSDADHTAEESPPSESATGTIPQPNPASPDDASQSDDSSCDVFDQIQVWKNHSLELEPLSFNLGPEELLPWQEKLADGVGGVEAAQGSAQSGTPVSPSRGVRGKVPPAEGAAAAAAESGDAEVSAEGAEQKTGVARAAAARTGGEEAAGVGQADQAGASSPREAEVSYPAESEKGQHEQLRDGGAGKSGAGPAGAEGGHAEVGTGVGSSAAGEVGLDAWRFLHPVAECLISLSSEFVIVKSLIPCQLKYTRKNQVVFGFLQKDWRNTQAYSRRRAFTVIIMSPLLRACRSRGPPSGTWFYDNGTSFGVGVAGLGAVQEFAGEGAGMSGPGQRVLREISGKRAVRGLPLQSAPTAEAAALFGELREQPRAGAGRTSNGSLRRARIVVAPWFWSGNGKNPGGGASWRSRDVPHGGVWSSGPLGLGPGLGRRAEAAGRVRAADSGRFPIRKRG